MIPSRIVLRRCVRAAALLLGATVAAGSFAHDAEAQARLAYRSGQNISPAYEGWREHEDGTRTFMFGYFNRNWEEEPDVEVGAENMFSPGPADQGQPTHFLPRRNRFVFEVPVPPGFTERDELVWTLKVNGIEERAYASLAPDYKVDDIVIASETGALGEGTSSPETRSNKAPVVELETPSVITAKVGQPVTLRVRVTDDGLPRENANVTFAVVDPGHEVSPAEIQQRLKRLMFTPLSRVTVGKTVGLHFTWFVYRGPNEVEFSPIQIKPWEDTRVGANSPWAPLWVQPPVPEDGRWVVEATFKDPGSYVLRGRADDGALFHDTQVTVNVIP
jgi:hypothetical protein